MVLLTSVYLGVKGFLSAMITKSQNPFYLTYLGTDATTYQLLATVSRTPWSMKALIGVLSDTFPIQGYHKKWYIFVLGICGTTFFCLLGCK